MAGLIIHFPGKAFVATLWSLALLSAVTMELRSAPAKSELASSAAVTFSARGGVYTSNLVVTLSAPSPSAAICYTVDGSEPTTQSLHYTDPLQITNSVVVKAKTFDGGQGSIGSCQTYTLADPSVTEFSSNLPLVILSTFGQTVRTEEKAEVSVRIIAPENGRARLTGSADVDSRALINFRGHSSLRYPKRSYQVKLRDADGRPAKMTVLGMPKESDWVLYAPYPDKTLLRDVLAYELSNQMGHYAARTRFVEVFLNSAGGRLSPRQYLGVFVLEEKIKRSKERVAIEKLGPEVETEPEISGGYIFKKDHLERVDEGANIGGFPTGGGPSNSEREGYPTGSGGFPGDPQGFLPTRGVADENASQNRDRLLNRSQGFTSSHGSQFLYVEPKGKEMTPNQRRWLSQHVRKIEAALYGPEFRDPARGYAAYLDVDSFIDYHWLVEATKNIDGFRFSTFFHKDRGGPVKIGPAWDWNLSFGAANGKQGFMPEYWYWPQLDDQQYSWYRRLFEDPDFAQRYVDRWGTLRTNQFSAARILARVDELAAVLAEAQARNFKRWKILGRQVWPQNFTGKSYADEVQYLKSWTVQRFNWIDRQFVAGPVATVNNARAEAKVVLRAATGKIYYTVDGSDPRAPGGAVSPSAQLYKGPVALKPTAAMRARVLQGKRWSWPAQIGVE